MYHYYCNFFFFYYNNIIIVYYTVHNGIIKNISYYYGRRKIAANVRTAPSENWLFYIIYYTLYQTVSVKTRRRLATVTNMRFFLPRRRPMTDVNFHEGYILLYIILCVYVWISSSPAFLMLGQNTPTRPKLPTYT